MKRIIAAGALALAPWMSAWAAPSWPNAAYSYYAKGESLQDVLRDFASGFSLALQITPGVQGTVSGKFNASNPTDFMDKLGGVYGFNWFVYAGTLFVSRASDMATRTISAMGGSISGLRGALQQLGIFDSRFGWGELPDQGIALVSGPPSYVDLIERTVAALPFGSGGQQVAVFRLKNASVNDRTVSYRDQKVTTPGLASVLRNLIQGTGDVGNSVLTDMAAPLRKNAGMPSFVDAEGSTVEVNAVARSDSNNKKPVVSATASTPSIQADTRLNAIIVKDSPERMPIYRQLIEQLDIPSTLIEIEAMIVDVNSEDVNKLGVDWGWKSGKYSAGYGDLTLQPSGGLPVGSTASAAGLIGLSVGNSLVARLHALQGRGAANILSQPSVLTTDNLGALIDLSETFYIQTQGERVAMVTPVTVGTSLRVTPRYIAGAQGQQVELTVDIEDGNVQNETQIDGLPTVRKSTISTLAVVGDQQTLLIGGYNSSNNTDDDKRVPFLGSIPGLGTLFSSKSKTIKRSERLFLIRPRLVAINGQMLIDPQPTVKASAPIYGDAVFLSWGEKPYGTASEFLDRLQKDQGLSILDVRRAVRHDVPSAPLSIEPPSSPPSSSLSIPTPIVDKPKLPVPGGS